MLMTTGIDCKTVKYIVIDKNIASMAEFKQIIGRGTRLYPDNGKLYFTIVDFRDATSKFADPDFDGDPEPSPAFYHDPVIIPDHSVPPDGEPPEGEKHGKRDKYYVNNVEVKVLNEHVLYYDKDGKLITESLIDYTKKNILGEYATLDSFLSAWTQFGQKEAIVEQLKDKGVLLEALRRESGNNELDDFDLICHIAYDAKPLTKQERINGVKKRDYLHKYQGVAREVLEGLLEKYKDDGIEDVEDLNVLQLDPFKQLGSPVKIAKEFGGRDGYVAAVKGLVKELYQ
jgi:type I restriction enzyme R subunit